MTSLVTGAGNLRLVPAVALRPARRPLALALIERLELWAQRRRQRLDLQAAPDALLRDIGVSRADAAREAGKPFWLD